MFVVLEGLVVFLKFIKTSKQHVKGEARHAYKKGEDGMQFYLAGIKDNSDCQFISTVPGEYHEIYKN